MPLRSRLGHAILDLQHISRRDVWRAVRWYVGAVATVQAAAITTVVTVDRIRKRREPPTGEFPRTAPATIPVADSTVTTFTYGADLYEDMLASIRSAERTIYFETFIWKSDETGQAFKDALLAAARRGVDVYIAFDSWGNFVVPPSFKRFPELANLHVLRFPFFRPGLLTMNIRKTGRDHRKLLVVDGAIGYVGGYNIGSLYATQWRDTHLRVDGPSVWELENAFVDFWNDHRRRRRHPEIPDQGARSWDARIRSAQNAPARLLFPVRGIYLEAIDRAQDHIYITQGYFIPDREILNGLMSAARRGVDVKVLIPEVSNHVIADWAARSYYSRLLEAGVTLWLFQGAMVHAKTMTVDGRWTTVGTTNIDRLSMTGNFEINLELYDDDLAAQMESIFATDLTNCRELTREEWQSRSALERVFERILRPLGPLL
ncbi:phospholipase D-like domain-containing protein [Georgenia subflava]|uniref:Phosphatidylserine/phosphatidylglycerophosphate/ cardiolipin synthase family protein n=1 Tax=Georgenia subflava TaxID=1622177 RepID=A0A6N7ELG1_9MICO|nr:phospholipase D-like domain-containing protein [Georgenia subflava]MPV38271.1 phosphatidylserine/phosphatidylglycerophosphate/cardiolipin synthase family protein [Georgenia subflava]